MPYRSAECRPGRLLAMPSMRGVGSVAALGAAIVLVVAAAPRTAGAQGVPLPPPPAGMKRIPLPPPPPGMTLQPTPGGAAQPERCSGCHAQLTQGRVMHGALEKHDCTACHKPVTAQAGKCKSRTASKWSLVRDEPELCYGCHPRKDQQKVVHTVIRQGSCLSCHAAHSSNNAGLITQPREKICLECHEVEPLLTKAVKHAPVSEGRCLDCHDPHGGNLPNNVKAESGSAFCLKCHDAKAPTGRGTPGPSYRIDMGKKVVHAAFKRIDCLGCHEGGHSSDNARFLKKNAVDLCYGCHDRKDKNKYPHSAVIVGDCAVCHDPHTSDNAKLVAKMPLKDTCFICHQDDLTGRKMIHAPVAKGCDQCHDPHGAQNRNALKGGEGKQVCYKCHKPVDTGKVKHAALERYGCTGCHDPHGAGYGALLPKKVNDLCSTCHPEQKDGRHVTSLASGGHVLEGFSDPKREGRDFSCASCHNPHGSDSPKLLRFGQTPMESCAWCHGDKSGNRPEMKNVISRAKRKTPDTASAGDATAVGAGVGSGSPGAGSGAGSPGAGSGAGSPGAGSGSPGGVQ